MFFCKKCSIIFISTNKVFGSESFGTDSSISFIWPLYDYGFYVITLLFFIMIDFFKTFEVMYRKTISKVVYCIGCICILSTHNHFFMYLVICI